MCKSGNNRSHKPRKQKTGRGKKGRIKKTTEHAESTNSDDEHAESKCPDDKHAESIKSDEEFFSQAAEQLAQAKKIREIGKDGGNYRTVAVRLNDVDVVMEADSGADVNIMDEHQFKAFIHRTNEPTLTKSSVKLHTLQHKLDVKGEFQTVIRNRTCGKATKFDVVSERIHSPPLFSKETLTELRMLKIHPDSCFAEPNDLAVSKEGHSKHC